MKKFVIVLFILGSLATFAGAFMCRSTDSDIFSMGMAIFAFGVVLIIVGATADILHKTRAPSA